MKKKVLQHKVNRAKRVLLIQKQQKKVTPQALIRFGTNTLHVAKGFSIQTGSFSTQNDAETHASFLELTFKQPVLIHVLGANPTTVFGVLAGHFQTLAEAEKFQLQLRNRHIDGFIRDLSSFSA